MEYYISTLYTLVILFITLTQPTIHLFTFLYTTIVQTAILIVLWSNMLCEHTNTQLIAYNILAGMTAKAAELKVITILAASVQ